MYKHCLIFLYSALSFATHSARIYSSPLAWLTIGHHLPIHQAVRSGCLESVRSVATRASNLDMVDENGQTALHVAACQGLVRIAQCLIQHGISLDARDKTGKTALHYAMQYCHDEISKELLLRGTSAQILTEYSVSNADNYRISCLDHAAMRRFNCIKAFFERHCEGSAVLMMTLLDYCTDLSGTLLCWLIKNKQNHLIKPFIQAGGDMEARDHYKISPLSWAILKGNEEAIKQLVLHGASKSITHSTILSVSFPEHEAKMKRYIDIVGKQRKEAERSFYRYLESTHAFPKALIERIIKPMLG